MRHRMICGFAIALVSSAAIFGHHVMAQGTAGAPAGQPSGQPAAQPAVSTHCAVRELPKQRGAELPAVRDDEGVAVRLKQPVATLPVQACWWIESRGGLGGGVYPTTADRYCDSRGPTPDRTCVIARPPQLDDEGLYTAHVYIGDSVESVKLLVAPSRWGLRLAMLGAFLVWITVSVTLKGGVERSRLKRWKEHLDDRLESSRDDHKLLLAHIQAALEFASEGLKPWRKKGLWHALTSLAVSERPQIEQHLREAEQLLILSERKTELWDRLDAHLCPPSIRSRVIMEFRLFDDLVLQSEFPLPPNEFKSREFAPLKRAQDLIDTAEPDYGNDLQAALALVQQSFATDESKGDASPNGGVKDKGDESPDDGVKDEGDESPNSGVKDILDAAIKREQAKIELLCAIKDNAPGFLLEVDLRLDILRRLRQAYREPHARLAADSLKASLDEWDTLDLQGSFSNPRYRRAYLDVLNELEWRPENQRYADLFKKLAGWQAPDTSVEAPKTGNNVVRVRPYQWIGDDRNERWPTYKPRVLTLEIQNPTQEFRALEDSYFWRRLISVTWEVTPKGKANKSDIFIISEDFKGDVRAGMSRTGPSTVAFGKRHGTEFTITPIIYVDAEKVAGTEQASGVVRGTPIEVTIELSTRETQVRHFETYRLARLGISLVATLATSVVLIGTWLSEPPPFVYWRAVLVPIGIDLTTLTVPTLLSKLKDLLTVARSRIAR